MCCAGQLAQNYLHIAYEHHMPLAPGQGVCGASHNVPAAPVPNLWVPKPAVEL